MFGLQIQQTYFQSKSILLAFQAFLVSKKLLKFNKNTPNNDDLIVQLFNSIINWDRLKARISLIKRTQCASQN